MFTHFFCTFFGSRVDPANSIPYFTNYVSHIFNSINYKNFLTKIKRIFAIDNNVTNRKIV